MTPRTRYAVLGALGGAVFGIASMVVPVFLKPGTKLSGAVAVFIVIGTAALGALFGAMTHDAR